MEWAEKYIGGKGLLLRYMWEEVPPKVDPWAAREPRHPHDGPVRRHQREHGLAPRGRLQEPATGILNDSYVGGSFAPGDEVRRLRRDHHPGRVAGAGRRHHQGRRRRRSSRPSRQVLGPQDVRDRRGHAPATSTPDAKTLSIGPAGEQRAPLGLPLHRPVPQGRDGAVTAPSGATRSSRPSPCAAPARWTVGDAKAFLADMYRIHTDYVLTEDNLWANEEGTPVLAPGHERRRRHPHAQLVLGHLRRDRGHQLRRLHQRAHQEPRLLPVRHRLPPVPRGRRHLRRGPGVRDHRPLRRQLRHRRHRRPRRGSTTSATSWASTPSPAAASSAWPWTSRRRASRTSACASARSTTYLKAPALIVERGGRRRRPGARRPRPGRQVRRARARHGGQEHGAAGLRPARLVRHEPRLRHVGPRRLPHAHVPHRRRDRRRHAAAGQPRGQGAEGRVGQPGRGHDRRELQRREVLRHLVRLLGGHARADRRRSSSTPGSTSSPTTRSSRSASASGTSGASSTCAKASRPTPSRTSCYAEEHAHTEGASAGRAIGTETFKQALQEFYAIRGWDENGVPSEAKLAELGVDVRL